MAFGPGQDMFLCPAEVQAFPRAARITPKPQ